jgi:hypothetical protein
MSIDFDEEYLAQPEFVGYCHPQQEELYSSFSSQKVDQRHFSLSSPTKYLHNSKICQTKFNGRAIAVFRANFDSLKEVRHSSESTAEINGQQLVARLMWKANGFLLLATHLILLALVTWKREIL